MAEQKQASPSQEIKHMLEKMAPQFKALMPTEQHVNRFIRVVMIAVQGNPALLEADRPSFYKACMDCAREGLQPDGREAVLLTYNTNVGTKQKPDYKKLVQYQPMVGGFFKKLRNSGEIVGAPNVQVWYEGDKFEYQLGDSPMIIHVPALTNRGKVAGAYSIVTFKDGEKSRELMTIEEIEAIRLRSKGADYGPWVTDFGEMCRKTVFRRHIKRLPLNTELERMLEHDNSVAGLDLGDETPAKEEASTSVAVLPPPAQPAESLTQALHKAKNKAGKQKQEERVPVTIDNDEEQQQAAHAEPAGQQQEEDII